MASLFLLASLSLLACSWSCHADPVADICAQVIQSHTITPATCARILRSNPHSRGADLFTLGHIAIKNAKVAVKDTATVAKAVGDLNNTEAGRVCVNVCNTAIDELNNIARMLEHSSKSNKIDIPFKLTAALTYVVTCDDTFALDVAGEPGEVKEASRIARGLIIVVQIIAGILVNFLDGN